MRAQAGDVLELSHVREGVAAAALWGARSWRARDFVALLASGQGDASPPQKAVDEARAPRSLPPSGGAERAPAAGGGSARVGGGSRDGKRPERRAAAVAAVAAMAAAAVGEAAEAAELSSRLVHRHGRRAPAGGAAGTAAAAAAGAAARPAAPTARPTRSAASPMAAPAPERRAVAAPPTRRVVLAPRGMPTRARPRGGVQKPARRAPRKPACPQRSPEGCPQLATYANALWQVDRAFAAANCAAWFA